MINRQDLNLNRFLNNNCCDLYYEQRDGCEKVISTGFGGMVAGLPMRRLRTQTSGMEASSSRTTEPILNKQAHSPVQRQIVQPSNCRDFSLTHVDNHSKVSKGEESSISFLVIGSKSFGCGAEIFYQSQGSATH